MLGFLRQSNLRAICDRTTGEVMPKKHSEEENKKRREEYEKSREGDFNSYIAMIGEGFASTINRLSQLIGNAHDPSVGRYKERLLMNVISDFIPGRYSVGSGFVMFPGTNIDSYGNSNSDTRSHEISKELDIIIYDSTNYSVIFKDQDFVIVKPESVRAIVEVKGVLNYKQIDKFMGSFIDFAKKWARASSLYRHFKLPPLKLPGLFVMNWAIAVDKRGLQKSSGKSLMKKIVKKYKAGLEISENFEIDYPLLCSAFIYNDCIVRLMDYVTLDSIESVEVGYSLAGGKLARYGQDGKLELGSDRTVAYLLAGINYYLDMPFNDFFIRPDLDRGLSASSHEFSGFEKWYTRKI